jgi:hypothetical protein
MAKGRTNGKNQDGERDQFRLELVGLQAGGERPKLVVQALDEKQGVLLAQDVGPDGVFRMPQDVLKRAARVVIGADDDAGGVKAEGAIGYRASEFAAQIRNGTLALAEGVWSRLLYRWVCVSGSVRVCRHRPRWFEQLYVAATEAVTRVSQPMARASQSLALAGSRKAAGLSLSDRLSPSLNDLIVQPFFRCYPVCLGTVEVYRRTCCCWPIVIDDLRIDDLIRDLEVIVGGLPKLPPPRGGFPPPPPPPIDPLRTPFFKGGALNELALNAASDLRVLRSVPRDQAAQYISSRPYLAHRLCSCGAPAKVATGTIQEDGTFNICWLEGWHLLSPNCYQQYAYVVKQTIGGTTTTIYDGLTAGAWYAGSDNPVLTSYNANAFSCGQTGHDDGQAYVYLDLIGDTESHELTTPDAAGWDRVLAPGATSGLLFPNPTGHGHLRNLGGHLELTFNFSEAMGEGAVNARYFRVSICRADATGAPTGPRHYFGDGLTWQKFSAGDIVPETLGPVPPVAGENFLYRIPYNAVAGPNALLSPGESWTGSVRHHAVINTLKVELNVPDATDIASPASNHLITLEVFNAAGERLRPLGVPPSGAPGTEVARPFKYRRWFQPGGSPGDDTKEVPFAALTHLFCWDNREPVADITRLVFNNVASDAECQFLVGDGDATFGVEYRAYVPDQRFQQSHGIGWIRGLNASVANGGVGSLGTFSPSNVGKPLDPPVNSGTNTFELMLTRLDPPQPPTVLEKCSFAVTLTTYAKTTDGASFSYPYNSETAAFALEIE